MDPNQKTEDNDYSFDLTDGETEEVSVDDFIRELEAKEKDLHITADTTFIEIAGDFDDPSEIPEFMRPAPPANGTQSVKASVPVPPPQPDNSPVKRLEEELADLKKRLSGLQEERTELYQNSQRRLKDFEAYKARTERERSETFQRQLSNLATQMLPVLDNLDRALMFASDAAEEKENGFTQFFDGIVLVNQQVNEVLVGMGIDPIATVGEQFDPHYHEAVAVDETSDLAPNTITAELLRGFRIGSKVIRHSMVKVSKSGGGSTGPTAEAVQPDGAGEAGDELANTFLDEDTRSLPPLEEILPTPPGSTPVEKSNAATLDSQFEIERNGEVDQDSE